MLLHRLKTINSITTIKCRGHPSGVKIVVYQNTKNLMHDLNNAISIQ